MFILAFNVQTLWPIALLLGIAVIIPILLDVLKLKIIPSLAIEMLVGVTLALIPATRNLFLEDEHLGALPDGIYAFGMAILLFLSGIDTDFSVFRRSKKGEVSVFPELLFSIIAFTLVVLLSFGASFIFYDKIVGNKITGIALLTICFSSTFASLVIPLVHDNDLAKTTIGKIIATYSTMAELVSIVGLSAIMVINHVSTNDNYWALLVIAIIFIIMFIVKRFIPIGKIFDKKLEGIVHLSTRTTMLIIVLSILLSDFAGVEYILGAFLAGMLLKALSITHHFENKLGTIGYGIFVPLFYILAGFKVGLIMHEIGLGSFFQFETLLLLLLVLGVIHLVKIPFFYLFRFYPAKTVLSTFVISTSTIIVALAIEHVSSTLNVFDEKLVVILVIASLVTCILPPILFANSADFGEAKEKYKPFILEKSDFENSEHEEV